MTTPYQPPANGFRTFVILWATQSFSVFGSALTMFAMSIWLATSLYPHPEQKAQLAGAISALALARFFPMLLLTPLAGAWADRHDRKRTMMVSDAICGGLTLVLLTLVATGGLQLWMLLMLQVLMAGIDAFHTAAFDTSYAMLVKEEQLTRANGMMQSMWALSGLLAPGAAALLIAMPSLARQGVVPGTLGALLSGLPDGTALALTVDSLTFVITPLVLAFLHVPSPRRTDLGAGKARKSIWADVREGATFIGRRRPLLWLLATFTVVNFTAAPVAIMTPLMVKFNLAADWTVRQFTFESSMALMATMSSAGGLAGGILISSWGGLKQRRILGVLVPMAAGGLIQVVFGFSTWIYVSAAAAGLMAAVIPILNAHSQAIWMISTPRELHGRVFSVRRVIAQFTSPLSMAFGGWAGGAFDPGIVLAVLGGIAVLFCLYQLFNPHLLKVEDKAALDRIAAGAAAH